MANLLNELQVLARLGAGEGDWSVVPNDFPESMTALRGCIGRDTWLVVEYVCAPDTSEKKYDGTFITSEGHFYRVNYDTAKAAFLKGKARIDEQTKK